eukprot:483097_1
MDTYESALMLTSNKETEEFFSSPCSSATIPFIPKRFRDKFRVVTDLLYGKACDISLMPSSSNPVLLIFTVEITALLFRTCPRIRAFEFPFPAAGFCALSMAAPSSFRVVTYKFLSRIFMSGNKDPSQKLFEGFRMLHLVFSVMQIDGSGVMWYCDDGRA